MHRDFILALGKWYNYSKTDDGQGYDMENGCFLQPDGEKKAAYSFDSPAGPLTVECTSRAVTALRFGSFAGKDVEAPALALLVRRELEEYFAGVRKTFDLPLAPAGTPFQLAVWRALCCIPYGQTRSYKDIAEAVGIPKACRAVGMANNRNPISIIIPCHRVIGADGKLVGYGGGIGIKRLLLKTENVTTK